MLIITSSQTIRFQFIVDFSSNRASCLSLNDCIQCTYNYSRPDQLKNDLEPVAFNQTAQYISAIEFGDPFLSKDSLLKKRLKESKMKTIKGHDCV